MRSAAVACASLALILSGCSKPTSPPPAPRTANGTPPPHRTHLMVMSLGSGATPLERTRNFHRLLAAVTIAAGSEAVGVDVGGVVTHDPVSFVEAIRASPTRSSPGTASAWRKTATA